MLEIQRNNKVLMEKLIDISKGKLSALTPTNHHLIKSMNSKKRTKTIEGIDDENLKMMMRIIKQKPQMSVKEMKSEYEAKKRSVTMISKSTKALKVYYI